MNGKIKKNRVLQVEQSVNSIAKYLDGLKAETSEGVHFYNGVEQALSLLENRPPVFRDVPVTPKKVSLKQKIMFYIAYIRFHGIR